jgi:protein-L-isoaspartate(D-aspartate) O-methyltransferase
VKKADARALRRRLVAELEQTGALRTPAVRDAFLHVPRELFVPVFAMHEGLEAVYRNELIITKEDARGLPTSSSSEPQIMAAMLEQLELREGLRVLEVGTGSGYNTALLKTLVGSRGRVVSVELDRDLARAARRALHTGGFAVRVRSGDGFEGYAPAAPFDRIVVTASSRRVPRAWLDQLVEGGLLEVPLRMRNEGAQAIATFRRHGNGLASTSVLPGRFLPMRSEHDDGSPPPTMTVNALLEDGRPILTRLSGRSLAYLSRPARQRLLAVAQSTPRRRPLGIRAPTWALGLYLSLELPERQLVMRFADLAVGVVGRGGRSLALVEGRWHGGERATPQWLVAYGDAGAEDTLTGVLDEWSRRGRPGRRELRIRVDFSGSRSTISHGWHPAER